MRCRLPALVCVSVALGAVGKGWGAPWSATGPGRCMQEVVEGEVGSGAIFERRLGSGLAVRLEPVPSGWILRVLPASGVRLAEDYAELATPPYRSVNPLRITTEFGFRAQDAVGWNPRRFRFATGERMFKEMELAYRGLGAGPGSSRESEARLARLVEAAPEGSIELLDARLAPGTADQTKAAALVATHLNTTAHTLEGNGVGAGVALGRLSWIRFRLRFNLPEGKAPESGVRFEWVACPLAGE